MKTSMADITKIRIVIQMQVVEVVVQIQVVEAVQIDNISMFYIVIVKLRQGRARDGR